MRRSLLAAVLALATLLVAVPTASAESTECNGVLTGTYDNVVVPSGSFCILAGAQVRNNVKVEKDGSLFTGPGTGPTTIGNNINAEGARMSLLFYETEVGGNYKVSGTDPSTLNGLDINVRIGGNFIYRNNEGNLFFDAAQVEGNADIDNNTGSLRITNNTIGKNLTCRNNALPIIKFNNTVGGRDNCPPVSP